MTEAAQTIDSLRDDVRRLGRRGAVVQVSGGVDSAVTLALSVRAFGAGKTRALFLPDEDSDPETQSFAEDVATSQGLSLTVKSIEGPRRALGLTEAAVEAVREYYPTFDPSSQGYALNFDRDASFRLGTAVFVLVIGARHQAASATFRVRAETIRTILAHQNSKQRLRMTSAYALAESEGFAVVGASNSDELDLGFVVKYGDDAADVYPIANSTKDEVRALAVELGVPQSVVTRPSTTDTFGLAQTQEEYYYGIPAATLRFLLETIDGPRPSVLVSRFGIPEQDVASHYGIARSLQWTILYNNAKMMRNV